MKCCNACDPIIMCFFIVAHSSNTAWIVTVGGGGAILIPEMGEMLKTWDFPNYQD